MSNFDTAETGCGCLILVGFLALGILMLIGAVWAFKQLWNWV